MRRKSRQKTSLPVVMMSITVFVFASFAIISGENPFRTLLALISGINVNHISSQSAKNIHYIQSDMVRLDGFPWDIIEPKKGIRNYTTSDRVMEWARSNELSVLGIIQYAPGWANGIKFTTPPDLSISNCGIPDLGNTNTTFNALRTHPPKNSREFGDYAFAIARRYPDVTYWQIWNEPNNPIFWPTGPDADKYADMLKAVYGKIKKANPQAQVVLGGISLNDLEYVTKLYKAGAKKYFDILAVHLYNPSQAPNAYLANELENLHATMIKQGDGKKAIWLTEIGWHTGTAAHAVTQRKQGEYLDQVFMIARSKSYVDAVFWNTLTDCTQGYDAKNPEHTFGIFRNNLTPKPAANVMRGIMLKK